MTCFWDGILNRLTEEDFKQFNIKKPKNKEFVLFLKKHNQQTTHVSWNNESLTKKQLEENFTHVKDFDVNTIGGGYFCSTFEPFLLLVSQLFQVNLFRKGNNLMFLILYCAILVLHCRILIW